MHEAELLKVFKFTVEKITAEVTEVVRHYHHVIEEVKLSNRLVVVENELDFFRKEALTLFDQNKHLQEEIKQLRRSLEDSQDEMMIKDSTVFSLTKKICKLKSMQSKQTNNLTLMTEPNLETAAKHSQCLARSTAFTKDRKYRSITSDKRSTTVTHGLFPKGK